MNLYGKILFILKYQKREICSSDFNVIPNYFYSTITQLVKDGLVEAFQSKSDSRKRFYKLTEEGKERLKKPEGFFL